MFKRKRGFYESYWHRKLNYDYQKEYAVYKFLCGTMRRKRQIRKVPENLRFSTYEAWKNYLNQIYSDKSSDLLREFYRYLNYHKQTGSIVSGFDKTFLIPFASALLAGFLFPKLLELEWSDFLLSLMELLKSYQTVDGIIQKFIMMLFSTVLFLVIILLVIASLFVPLGWLVYVLIKAIFEDGMTTGFYEDYMEVIEQIIRAKEGDFRI